MFWLLIAWIQVLRALRTHEAPVTKKVGGRFGTRDISSDGNLSSKPGQLENERSIVNNDTGMTTI